MIRVLFFGPVAECIGMREVQAAWRPGMFVQNLRDEFAAQYPQAFEIVCLTAVNGEQVRDLAQPLADGSEVAFMSGFSGG